MKSGIIAFVITALATQAYGKSEQSEDWMVVTFDGKKVGHIQKIKEHNSGGSHIITRSQVDFQRGAFSTTMISEESIHFTPDGQPQEFTVKEKFSAVTSETHGKFTADNQIQIDKTVLDNNTQSTHPWKPDMLLFDNDLSNDGIRLQAGHQSEVSMFIPAMQKSATMTYAVEGKELVNILGQEMSLYKLNSQLDLGALKLHTTDYVDDSFAVKKSITNLMGSRIEMYSCPKACALAPNDIFDAIDATVIQLQSPISDDMLSKTLKFTFKSNHSLENVQLPNSSEQRIQKLDDNRFSVTVHPPQKNKFTPGYQQSDLQASEWIQSDHPEIIKLAKKATSRQISRLEKMHAIENFVRNHIHDKNFSIGYASALETAQYRNGDCTEHALLTAALGRASGIPTRVAIGLAYMPSFQGHQNTLGLHAWTQAWVDGSWRSFDASLDGFDSGHIALAYGTGNPNDFYSGMMLIGQLEIESVQHQINNDMEVE